MGRGSRRRWEWRWPRSSWLRPSTGRAIRCSTTTPTPSSRDGDLEEGISHEAASLAGHLRLGKIIYLYDNNHISIDGPTELSFSEDVGKRFEAYGWHVQEVDAYDMVAISEAIRHAQRETGRPSLIMCRSTIGFGSPNKAGTAESHGTALGEDEVRLSKEKLGLPPDEYFWVPDEALARFRQAIPLGERCQSDWRLLLDNYAQEYPELAEQVRLALAGELPAGWDEGMPSWSAGEKMATRSASGKVLDAIAPRIPTLIGGSADLTPSNNTRFKGVVDIKPGEFGGRYIRFGVREHAMGAVLNGLALHGGVFPYGGTFFVFSDYMRPAVRIAALSQAPSIFVWTHDSVGLGEDGPTHQPIEHLLALRAMPELVLLRPADANETVAAWRYILTHREMPVGLLLSRQNIVVQEGTRELAGGLERGAYVLADAENGRPDVIIIGTGSEVELAMAARKQLAGEGIHARVVSMPSWGLFDKQDEAYRESVLPRDVKARVSVEAGVTMGWERYIGRRGIAIGVDRFGSSGKYTDVYPYLGLTAERVADAARRVLRRDED